MINRYNKIKESTIQDTEFNDYYPDIMTFPINRFEINKNINSNVYYLSQFNIDRIDLLCNDIYTIPYFDDIILWLNDIYYKNDLIVGQELLFPEYKDIANFFIKDI